MIIFEREVFEILNKNMASSIYVNFFIRNLYHNYLVPCSFQDKIKFILPDLINNQGDNMKVYVKQRHARFLKDEFLRRALDISDTYFLVPYVQGNHWILIVVNPMLKRIWYYDSMSRVPNMRPYMQETFNEVVCTYRTQNGLECTKNKLTNGTYKCIFQWLYLKCAKQLDKSNDYGYYMMQYMKDIITNGLENIDTIKYFDASCTIFSNSQMKEVAKELVTFMQPQWESKYISNDCKFLDIDDFLLLKFWF